MDYVSGCILKRARNTKMKLKKLMKGKCAKLKITSKGKHSKIANRVSTPFHPYLKKVKFYNPDESFTETGNCMPNLTPSQGHVSTSTFESDKCKPDLLIPSPRDVCSPLINEQYKRQMKPSVELQPKKLFKSLHSLRNSPSSQNSSISAQSKALKPSSQRQKTPYKIKKKPYSEKLAVCPLEYAKGNNLCTMESEKEDADDNILNENKPIFTSNLYKSPNASLEDGNSLLVQEEYTSDSSIDDGYLLCISNNDVSSNDSTIVEYISISSPHDSSKVNLNASVLEENSKPTETSIKHVAKTFETHTESDTNLEPVQIITTSENLPEIETEFENNIDKYQHEEEDVVIEDVHAKANYFNVNCGILIVLHASKLYFNGFFSLECLYGAAEIFGYTLKPTQKSVDVFSPKGSSFLYVESKSTYVEEDTNKLLQRLVELNLSEHRCQDVTNTIQSSSTVLLLTRISSNQMPFIEKHIPQQLYPKCEQSLPQCVFYDQPQYRNVLNISEEWGSFIDTLTTSSKAFVCGGKSVGKSVFLRYTINRLIATYHQILVIDLDPGQSEFTIPGAISAVIVDKPLLGPNYTHLMTPKKCIFIPFVNVAYDPKSYLHCVKELMKTCKSLPSIPTIINYMGFTKGIGINLAAAAIANVQPNIVVEILSDNKQQNFGEELNTYVAAKKSQLLEPGVKIPPYELHVMKSVADNQGWQLQPREIRELCVLSYFSNVLSSDVTSITSPSVPVYLIHFSSIKIVFHGQEVSPMAANANLVGLCSISEDGKCCTCYGWGIVRGIDANLKKLYLITPLSTVELEKVDLLALGSVFLPPSLHMTTDSCRGLMPYISEGVSLFGQISKRSFIPSKRNTA